MSLAEGVALPCVPKTKPLMDSVSEGASAVRIGMLYNGGDLNAVAGHYNIHFLPIVTYRWTPTLWTLSRPLQIKRPLDPVHVSM
jgi:hypothetical protein